MHKREKELKDHEKCHPPVGSDDQININYRSKVRYWQ